MKLALCNEVIREAEFSRQCAMAAGMGYAGLELAPFTLGEDTYRMGSQQRAALRRAAGDAGVEICGLHWLLVAPPGLSITSEDKAVRDRTIDVMRRLVDLCADLGGSYLVHGSPAQRKVGDKPDPKEAARRGEAAWAAVAADATKAKVAYCIEPLGAAETDFVNTLAEAAAIVRRIDSPGLRTMIDTSAAARMEPEPVADAIRRWMPSGLIGHVQLNDRNRRGPGEGEDRFLPVIEALRATGYVGWLAMEPFEYLPDGPTCAARAIGYVQGLLEATE
ncbi:MAG: sugar phosphate isomerase/epimerase [Alphaproteobacteria bacterium]|nr:sugar phosphate isomerase/epimerase [Alphaproteobacteria bacterium]